MPTATTAGILSLSNIGALTTTFTAPSSCATAPGFTRSGLANPLLEMNLIQPVDNCGGFPDFDTDCVPGGEAISRQRESLEDSELLTVLNYYSPALHCPDAWATVGVFAPNHQANGSAPGDLGVFSPTAFNEGRPGQSTSFPYGDFDANMFTSALASTETAVICCPSGFSVDPYAGCYSHFPVSSLADKTGCYGTVTREESVRDEMFTTTWEYWGHTTTVVQQSYEYPTETDRVSIVTVAFDDSGMPPESDGLLGTIGEDEDATELRGIAVIAPMYLVHGGADGGGSNGEGGEGENENENEAEDDDQDEESSDDDGDGEGSEDAGGRLSPVAAVLTAWGFSVAAGLGLLVAW